ncbi:MAG: DUF4397 domain-containing protein [Cyclobacteriaceae bacterium]
MNLNSPGLRSIFFSIVIILFLSSCMDENNNVVTEPVQVAFVSVYHAAPDAPEFDIVVDDRTINTNPFDYASYSGYLNFVTGSRNIKFTAVNASSALLDTTFSFSEGKAYSLFAVDRLSKLDALLVVDSAAVPSAGKAMVRFVHLSPDAPALDITLSGIETPLFSNKVFKQATSFQEIDARNYSIALKNAGGSDAFLSADDINIVAGRYYTIITRGFATPPAGNANVLSIQVID